MFEYPFWGFAILGVPADAELMYNGHAVRSIELKGLLSDTYTAFASLIVYNTSLKSVIFTLS